MKFYKNYYYKVLRQYNPWWRSPSVIKKESKPQKRLAYYEALRMIKHKTIRRFAVLSGARRVGKSTIMYQLIENLIDDVLSDEKELGAMVETTVYKHIVSFYQGSTAQLGYFRKAKDNQKEVDVVVALPHEKILCEVKYRNNSHIPATDAIVELCKDEDAKVTSAFLITKRLDD